MIKMITYTYGPTLKDFFVCIKTQHQRIVDEANTITAITLIQSTKGQVLIFGK